MKLKLKLLKAVSLFTAAAFVTTALSGCGKKNTGTNRTEEVISKTVFYITGNTGGFQDDWPVFKKAEEITGIHLTTVLSKHNTEAPTAYNLMMASGDVAEIVGAAKTDIEKYVPQGVYIPLNDLIDKHAPNIKKFLSENPEIRRSATYVDGKMYYIPFISDGDVQQGWFIRKDWLKKLELDVPKNIDELYNVLKAFKEKDPNGNGKPDEVPFFNRGKNVEIAFPLFGIRGTIQIAPETDTVVYDKYSEKYKTAVINVAKWYKEGLIDKEVYTRVNDARAYMLDNNLGGFTNDWFTSTSSFNQRLPEKIQEFDFAIIPPPADKIGRASCRERV